MTSLPQVYEITPTGLTIDGTPFPYFLEEGGPRVEQIEPGCPIHILWLPLLIEKPAPAYMTDKPGTPAHTTCVTHKLVQHRDGKPPWCNTCGTH